jgi:hypothetical protein
MRSIQRRKSVNAIALRWFENIRASSGALEVEARDVVVPLRLGRPGRLRYPRPELACFLIHGALTAWWNL